MTAPNVTNATPADDVTWWQSADGTAHAFRGVKHPVCRAWWAARVTAAGEMPRCADCELVVFGAPGEVMEAWGR